jgi:hypothetical protein
MEWTILNSYIRNLGSYLDTVKWTESDVNGDNTGGMTRG